MIKCHWDFSYDCEHIATKFNQLDDVLYAECGACASTKRNSVQIDLTYEEYIVLKTEELLDD